MWISEALVTGVPQRAARLLGADLKELACAVDDETTVANIRVPFASWAKRISPLSRGHSIAAVFTWRYLIFEERRSGRHIYREERLECRTSERSVFIVRCCRLMRRQLRSPRLETVALHCATWPRQWYPRTFCRISEVRNSDSSSLYLSRT